VSDISQELKDFMAQFEELAEFREQIVRDTIGRHTVAILVVAEPDRLTLGGTGTLVSFLNSWYILTAAHVWKENLENAERIAITLKEDVEHKYLLDPHEIVAIGPAVPKKWDEWGADVTLLRIPAERAADIQAKGRVAFYNLSIARQVTGLFNGLVTRALIGTPNVWGEFQGGHADLLVNAIFCGNDVGPFDPIDTPPNIREDFDYIDLNIDPRFGPPDYRGVSGGGLWRLVFYGPDSTGEIARLKLLDGVAFCQQVEVDSLLA
jgi:hypothetical protein